MATGRIGTTPVLRTRWSKEPAGGTTSLSGLDDYSVSLVYEVGYEAVYQNGALLSRGNDYTATNGTTITLTNATVAGDIIEVFANNVVPLTDTYSQSVADGKFVNNTIVDAKGDLIVGSAADTFTRLAVGSANQVLTVDSATTSGLKWATPSSGALVKIANTTFTNVASQSFNNVFSSTYEHYVAYLNVNGLTSDTIRFYWRASGTDNTSSNYNWGVFRVLRDGTSNVATNGQDVANCVIGAGISTNTIAPASFTFTFYNPASTTKRKACSFHMTNCNTYGGFGFISLQGFDSTSFDGFTVSAASGNVTGNLQIYGVTP